MINKQASTTYLFDSQRTGRLKYAVGGEKEPKLLWKFRLRSFPEFCPESTSAFDSVGNQYFGAHDGCFYSLTPEGKFRWSFCTRLKIYSSPCVLDQDKVVFASGNGTLFCLTCSSGDIVWVRSLPIYNGNPYLRRYYTLTNLFAYDYTWSQRLSMKTWASPNVSEDEKTIYMVSRGIGLHAVNAVNGHILWSFNLGQPWNHSAGVALDNQGYIYVPSQKKYLNAISPDGQLIWRFSTKMNLTLWGNPSIDMDRHQIYFTGSRGSNIGYAFAVDFLGQEIWRQKLPGGTRGGISISQLNMGSIACLNGNIVFLKLTSGEYLTNVRLGRQLWTTPSIDVNSKVLVATAEDRQDGSVYCLSETGDEIWRVKVGHALSTPIIDAAGRLYIGSWLGYMYCFQT